MEIKKSNNKAMLGDLKMMGALFMSVLLITQVVRIFIVSTL
jgi:hypothetical protein